MAEVSASVAASVAARVATEMAAQMAADVTARLVPLLVSQILKDYEPAQPVFNISLPPMASAFSVIVPETEEEIEVTERSLDGSMKKATKTTRHKK